MFDLLLDQIIHIDPDDLKITAEGKVYDNNDFERINQAI
jgi:hypothetical protein